MWGCLDFSICDATIQIKGFDFSGRGINCVRSDIKIGILFNSSSFTESQLNCFSASSLFLKKEFSITELNLFISNLIFDATRVIIGSDVVGESTIPDANATGHLRTERLIVFLREGVSTMYVRERSLLGITTYTSNQVSKDFYTRNH